MLYHASASLSLPPYLPLPLLSKPPLLTMPSLGTKTGRIFLGGEDGCLYELGYHQGTHRCWSVSCYQINGGTVHAGEQHLICCCMHVRAGEPSGGILAALLGERPAKARKTNHTAGVVVMALQALIGTRFLSPVRGCRECTSLQWWGLFDVHTHATYTPLPISLSQS